MVEPHYEYAHLNFLKAVGILDLDGKPWDLLLEAWSTELVHIDPDRHLNPQLAAEFRSVKGICLRNEQPSNEEVDQAHGKIRSMSSRLGAWVGEEGASSSEDN